MRYSLNKGFYSEKRKEKHYCLYFILQIYHDGLFQVNCSCEVNTIALFRKHLDQLMSGGIFPLKNKMTPTIWLTRVELRYWRQQ